MRRSETMQLRTILLCSVLAATALAGCADNDGAGDDPATTTPATTTPTTTPVTTTPVTTTPEPTPDAPVFTLTADGVPATAIVGQTFTFELTVEGDESFETDHLGAHYDVEAHPAPEGAYGKGCDHQLATVPGTFTIECTIAETGTHFLRGHLRLNVSDTLHNYWTDEFEVEVREPVGNYTLTTVGMPTLPVAPGDSFNFTLTIAGESTDHSDHIGGHFGMNSTDDDVVVGDFAYGCQHQSGEVPGEFTVTCPVPDDAAPGTYYLRGHLRITAAGVNHEFWADQDTFLVV